MFSGQNIDTKVRKTYLKTLLEKEDAREESDERAPTYQQLNEMLARSEDELELFNRMDKEMLEQDKEWINERRRNRLVAAHELPKFMRRDDAHVKYLADKTRGLVTAVLTSSRKRKHVQYNDDMSELQFMKAVESGKYENPYKKGKRGEEEEDVDVDDDDNEDEERKEKYNEEEKYIAEDEGDILPVLPSQGGQDGNDDSVDVETFVADKQESEGILFAYICVYVFLFYNLLLHLLLNIKIEKDQIKKSRR
eukprot:m.131500 g.131500  ORF g.131500 m.131500 type:complete len:251 (+) comp13075_c1_seq12:149-901(+)